MMLAAEKDALMSNIQKLPPVIEDLRKHSPEQLLELHLLLKAGFTGRPDVRRPGFFEIDGVDHVYYIFRYPTGHKVLLVAAWQKEADPVAELVSSTCHAA